MAAHTIPGPGRFTLPVLRTIVPIPYCLHLVEKSHHGSSTLYRLPRDASSHAAA